MTALLDTVERSTYEVSTSKPPAVQGSMSEVLVTELTDGSKFVTKITNNWDITNEYLCHEVAKIMGIPVPDLVRIDNDTIVMSFIDGITAEDVDWDEFHGWTAGRIDFFDFLIANRDRNCGNVIKSHDDGLVYAIDNACTLEDWCPTLGDEYAGQAYQWYTEDEVAYITTELHRLRQLFIDEGMGQPYKVLMEKWSASL